MHFTKIINGEKTEGHLCEQCSQENGYSSFFSSSNANFSFHNLLSGLLNIKQPISGGKPTTSSRNEDIQCPKCHMTYQQFAKIGKFGCASCYSTFQDYLNPILRRLHSGNVTHHGKIPKRIGGNIHLRKELEELKHRLQHHIQQEEFEEAAQMRDRIRTIEKQLSAHRKEE